MPEPKTGKINTGHLRYAATAIAVVIVAAVVIFYKMSSDRRTYSGYRIEQSREKTDNISKYEYVEGYVLKYSSDGAELLRKDMSSAWTASYSMTDPRIDLSGTHILMYDRLGTRLYIFDLKGEVSSFQAGGPVLKARISDKNTVAVLTRNGDNVGFAYYSADGTPIASGESTMTDPGYPLGIALSGDGTRIAISYLTVSGGTIGSCVRFYNFGRAGRDHENNMVAEEKLDSVVAPEIDYFDGNECVLLRDNGFTVYRGQGDISVYKSVDFTGDIVSAFHDGSHMGFVFRSEDKSHRYDMQIYSTSGNLVSTCHVDEAYSNVHVCGDHVVFSNSSGFSVYSMRGVCRYSGTVSGGGLSDVLRIGRDRFLALTDYHMEILRLV
ncbi:MAG: DUF5711 family protein [Lachnospiraceae bacterium]|nr:DUF5711 family protein [Lachnospiraceae bacterium]